MSSCNGLLRLLSSTTYLPLLQRFVTRLIFVRKKMLGFPGYNGLKYRKMTLIATRCRIPHVFRVQEASGSNPDTPTMKRP